MLVGSTHMEYVSHNLAIEVLRSAITSSHLECECFCILLITMKQHSLKFSIYSISCNNFEHSFIVWQQNAENKIEEHSRHANEQKKIAAWFARKLKYIVSFLILCSLRLGDDKILFGAMICDGIQTHLGRSYELYYQNSADVCVRV